VGPVPLKWRWHEHGTKSIAFETIKGLRTTICEGITLPKRKLPAFDDSFAKGPLKADKESMDKLASDMVKRHITLVQWGYESELNEMNSSPTLLDVFKRLPVNLQRKFCEVVAINLIGYVATFLQLLPFVDAAERAHSSFGVTWNWREEAYHLTRHRMYFVFAV